jgi:hypothetical protein
MTSFTKPEGVLLPPFKKKSSFAIVEISEQSRLITGSGLVSLPAGFICSAGIKPAKIQVQVNMPTSTAVQALYWLL